MQKLTYTVSVATLATTAAAVIAAGSANAAAPTLPGPAAAPASPAAPAPVADPGTLSVPLAPRVRYTGNTQDHSARLSTPIGTLTTQGSALQLTDAAGRTLAGSPFTTPPKAAIAAPAPTSTAPQQNSVLLQQPAPAPGPARPVDQQSDFNAALGQVAMQFGLATGVGSMVGGVAGAVIGCPVGALTGGALSVVVLPATPLAAVGGCILGAGAIGGLGAIGGGALVGGTVGIASAVQMYDTLHAKGEA